MNIDYEYLTIKQIKEIQELINFGQSEQRVDKLQDHAPSIPMVGRRCLVRTYSAGVHIGDVVWVNPENLSECQLMNALRLWKWSDGGLSLSAVARNGINNGRLNRTGEILLTNAIEYLPTTRKADESYEKFIEDDED